MRSFCFLILFLWLIHLTGQTQTYNKVNSIKLIPDGITESDTTVFKQWMDTIAYFAGRDLNTALNVALAMEEHLAHFSNAKFKLQLETQIAQLYLLNGNADSSQIHVENGLKASIKQKDSLSLMSFYYLKGWLNKERNRTGEAQTAYLKGLEIAEATNNYEEQINFLSGLSYGADNFENAKVRLGFLYRAKQIGEKHQLKKTNTYLNILYHMAGILQQNGKPDTAIIIYNELQKNYLDQNYISGLASVANNVAHIYLENKDYDKALDKAYEALKYDSITGTAMYIVGDMISIAKIQKGMGKTDRAIYYYNQADSISLKSGMISRRMEITKNIAELYAGENRFKEAFYALQQNIAAKDTFNMVETKKRLHELQDKYELEQKELENKTLRINRDLDQKKILLQLILMGLLIIVAAVAIAQLISNRKKQVQIQQLNKDLNCSNLELRQANHTKDKFFSIISHDLRGPIGSLRNLLSTLNEEGNNLSIDEAQIYMVLIEKELNNTYDLLDNLLTWARSQFGKINYNPQNIEVCTFVRETLKPLIAVADNKHISIIQDTIDCSTIVADKGMLAFILRNLVSNAIKFTPENGQISITGHEEEHQLLLSVADNGVGMSEKQLSAIFKLSENASTKGTNNEPGTGLGLILCKEFVDKNSGNIWVDSEKGKGTIFSFSIPNSKTIMSQMEKEQVN